MDDRRDYLTKTGVALTGGLLATRVEPTQAVRADAKSARLAQLASNSYPIRTLFKRRAGGREMPDADAMKQKYGELTLLDFAQFTRDTFPGVKKMDVWSSLFGDVTDASMYVETTVTRDGRSQSVFEFDPTGASAPTR